MFGYSVVSAHRALTFIRTITYDTSDLPIGTSKRTLEPTVMTVTPLSPRLSPTSCSTKTRTRSRWHLHRGLWLVTGILLSGWSVSAQPLTPAEAEAAYRAAQPPNLEPGCYKSLSTHGVSYQYILAEGNTLYRSELQKKRGGKRPSVITLVTIRNAEGTWHLYDGVAVLEPKLDSAAAKAELTSQFPEVATSMRELEQSFKAEAAAFEKLPPEEKEKARARLQPIWSGEKFIQENGVPGIRIRQKFSEAMLARIYAMLEAMPKAVPFLFRPIVKPFFKMMKENFPCEHEYVIDTASNRVIAIRAFTAKGELVSATKPDVWEPCDPAGLFEIPPGLQLLRPKSAFEATRLQNKYEDALREKAEKAFVKKAAR